MKPLKKVLTAGFLGITLVTSFAATASAASLFQTKGRTSNLPGVDSWNRGIYSGGKYYMAYSYYDNSVYTHSSAASLGGVPKRSAAGAPGTTVTANSDSRPSYSDGITGAGADKGGWKYVRDTGSGDYVGGRL